MTRSPKVQRHQTALVRTSLSTPMRLLERHRLFTPGCTVLDYGCGRGDDVRILQSKGINATGWDPHFAPKVACVASDVVNLGFVLNVIEDPKERVHALERAWSLTRVVLAIAVMLGTKVDGVCSMNDGVLTSRSTFQKLFAAWELRYYVRQVLKCEPVTVAPGVAFVFRDDEQRRTFARYAAQLSRCSRILRNR